MGRDPYTPACMQHIAFEFKDRATLLKQRERLEKSVEVLGVTDRGAFHSFLFERNGHRIEQDCPEADEDAIEEHLDWMKWGTLEKRSNIKRARQSTPCSAREGV